MKKILGCNPLDTYAIAAGQTLAEGELAVINASNALVKGDDGTAVKVVGYIEGINSAGAAIVETGIISLANSDGNAVARKDRGAKCYVEDGLTVGITGTVCAGTVVDVTATNVFVNITDAGAVLGAHIADVAAVTQDATVDSSGGTAGITFAAITETGNTGSADVAPVKNAVASIAAQLAKIKADNVAQNAKINAILAALETQGVIKTV
jgi:hypothetical protein